MPKCIVDLVAEVTERPWLVMSRSRARYRVGIAIRAITEFFGIAVVPS